MLQFLGLGGLEDELCSNSQVWEGWTQSARMSYVAIPRLGMVGGGVTLQFLGLGGLEDEICSNS